jgi:hypothetical protein
LTRKMSEWTRAQNEMQIAHKQSTHEIVYGVKDMWASVILCTERVDLVTTS